MMRGDMDCPFLQTLPELVTPRNQFWQSWEEGAGMRVWDFPASKQISLFQQRGHWKGDWWVGKAKIVTGGWGGQKWWLVGGGNRNGDCWVEVTVGWRRQMVTVGWRRQMVTVGWEKQKWWLMGGKNRNDDWWVGKTEKDDCWVGKT